MIWVELALYTLATFAHRMRRTVLALGLTITGIIVEPCTFAVISLCAFAIGARPKIQLDWLQ